MVNTLVSALVGGIIAVIAFVVIKNVISAQTTTDWTGAEIAIIVIYPLVIGLIGIIAMFMLLTKIRG